MSLDLDPRLIDALLTWQAELGADEYIGDAPVDRFAATVVEAERRAAAKAAAPAGQAQGAAGDGPRGRPAPPPPPPAPPKIDAPAESRAMAARVTSLDELAQVQSAYPHCELRKGARNFVFRDGVVGAEVMVIGEAPGSEEDRTGRPFLGTAGQLLDLMFDAIGLDRHAEDPKRAIYITNVLPWRPPGGRDPSLAEIEMMVPFLRRHIELAAPKVVVLVGNHACQALLGQSGITKLRGQWSEVMGLPALPMLHPAYLLRNPSAKRLAWADLLSLQTRLRQS